MATICHINSCFSFVVNQWMIDLCLWRATELETGLLWSRLNSHCRCDATRRDGPRSKQQISYRWKNLRSDPLVLCVERKCQTVFPHALNHLLYSVSPPFSLTLIKLRPIKRDRPVNVYISLSASDGELQKHARLYSKLVTLRYLIHCW